MRLPDMKTDQPVIAAMLAFALLVPSSPSAANTRLPIRSELPPSSALFSPTRDLTVLHEDLQFDCDSAGCQVSATYRIRSKQQAKLKMSFISPSSRVEAVTINGSGARPGSVRVAKFPDFPALIAAAQKNVDAIRALIQQAKKNGTETTPEYEQLLEKIRLPNEELDRTIGMSYEYRHYAELFGKLTHLADTRTEDCQALPDLSKPRGWERYVACLLVGNTPDSGATFPDMKQPWTLYQFDFDAAIRSGENTLQVRYHQPYSFAEPYVAYFKSPSPMRYVSYELWPIKEWSLDPAFKIDLVVRFKNARHGFLYLKRDGLLVSAGRFKDDAGDVGLFRSSPSLSPKTLEVQPDGRLMYKTSLQGDISDRLFIITGEEDTLNDVRNGYEQMRKFREEHEPSRSPKLP